MIGESTEEPPPTSIHLTATPLISPQLDSCGSSSHGPGTVVIGLEEQRPEAPNEQLQKAVTSAYVRIERNEQAIRKANFLQQAASSRPKRRRMAPSASPVSSTIKMPTKKELKEKLRAHKEGFLEIREYVNKGRGVICTKDLKSGDLVCEYKGELLGAKIAKDKERIYNQTPEVGSYMYDLDFGAK